MRSSPAANGVTVRPRLLEQATPPLLHGVDLVHDVSLPPFHPVIDEVRWEHPRALLDETTFIDLSSTS